MATLLAARRNDVVSLLSGSLNPADFATVTAHIPQHHFVGNDDDVVPPFVAQEFLKKSGDTRCIRIYLVEGALHNGGWAELWRDQLKQPVVCRAL